MSENKNLIRKLKCPECELYHEESGVCEIIICDNPYEEPLSKTIGISITDQNITIRKGENYIKLSNSIFEKIINKYLKL